jgi:tRNA uridine 5-carbamoylmethylation protein Kti12
MLQKTVIINRAVPGSGKTTITNCIINELKQNNVEVALHSTDEYFMVGNRYVFEIEKLGKYHQKNLEEFQKSLKNNVDVVICDNTNLLPWQSEPYTNLARKHGYKIVFITLDPRELEKHVESQKVTPQKPDAHNVSKEIIEKMIQEYKLFDDLLNPRFLIDNEKHYHYKWDEKSKQKIKVGATKHFDCDVVIRILPNEYKEIQETIGSKVLNIIAS